MNSYMIWVNLAPGATDLELVDAVNAYAKHFEDNGAVESWRIRRRKFGFGPPELGEFCIEFDFINLAQMDRAFEMAARRDGEMEKLHSEVYSRVKDFRSGLFRDFPDKVRVR